MKPARLALADGTIFEGHAFGADAEAVGEVVFNTSMTGYQEILTDPSYAGQLVTMTYPEIGNYGINAADAQAARVHAAGFIVKHACPEPSSWRSESTLADYLRQAGVPGIAGIDTRALTRLLRTKGAQMGVITTERASAEALVERARAAGSMEGQDLASRVSTPAPFAFTEPGAPAAKRAVTVVDYGVKRGILRMLVQAGCAVTVVPWDTTADQILAGRPDGVVLSNGPGDPAAVPGAGKNVQALLGKVPIFGICLGHQIMGLALGGKTYKLKFGHRGANHPVKDLATGRIDITAQNHGFAVDEKSLAGRAQVTHLNLYDRTVEGIAAPEARAFAVQYHPEASPGPNDARHLFRRFVESI